MAKARPEMVHPILRRNPKDVGSICYGILESGWKNKEPWIMILGDSPTPDTKKMIDWAVFLEKVKVAKGGDLGKTGPDSLHWYTSKWFKLYEAQLPMVEEKKQMLLDMAKEIKEESKESEAS